LRKIFGGDEVFYIKKISSNLIDWIKNFDPDLVYAHFSCLNDILFIKQILDIKSSPLVVHLMDDFLQFQYKSGFFAPLLRILWNRESTQILRKASKRICISDKMALFYKKKYKLDFVSYFNTIDCELWRDYPVNKHDKNGKFEIVYSGTINNKNIKNLIAMSEIVEELNEIGQKVIFSIYTFPSRLEIFRRFFENKPSVTFSKVLEGNSLIPLLKNSDLLFLPVDFSKESVKKMKFSMFAKIPAYMISGSPILVYGPSEVEAVEYAEKSSWAYVISEENKDKLKNALLKLIADKRLRFELSQKAQNLAIKHHDSRKIREKFKAELCGVLNTNTGLS